MLRSYLACFLALLAGLLAPLSFAPYHIWPLMLLSLMALLGLLHHSHCPTRVGFCYGLGMFGLGINWVHVSIYRFGGMPIWLSEIIVIALAIYLAIFPALSCWLASRWQGFKGRLFSLVWFPTCYLVGEWLRSRLWTGFPWLMPGYSQSNSPLGQFGALVGVFGVTLILLLFAGALVELIRKPLQYLTPLTILATLYGLSRILGIVQFTTSHAPIKVALVQGNEAIPDKWAHGNRIPTLKRYWQLTEHQTRADVIIWPESALPICEKDAHAYLQAIDKKLTKRHQALITGIINQSQQKEDYYNALIVLGQKTTTRALSQSYYLNGSDRYYKRHLLPIGEFVPFSRWLRPLAKLFDLPMSSFSSGRKNQDGVRVKGHLWLAAICYEIAFGNELRKLITPSVDAIVTISNDAWFSNSIGPAQHLQIAQMRAIEFGRPVVRDTNTGQTAIINSHGQFVAYLPTDTIAVLNSSITPATEVTPYQCWGSLPVYLFMTVALLMFIVHRYYQPGIC